MLLKIFREELASKLREENEVRKITQINFSDNILSTRFLFINFIYMVQNLEDTFRCIEDIAELTITLISTIEDTVEMTEPNYAPAVGICLLELAEVSVLNIDYIYL